MELKHLYLCNAFRSRTIREIQKRDITNRTELNGIAPTELYIVAQKVENRCGTLVLQQGDYEQKWSGNAQESTFVTRLRNSSMGNAVYIKALWTDVAVKKNS